MWDLETQEHGTWVRGDLGTWNSGIRERRDVGLRDVKTPGYLRTDFSVTLQLPCLCPSEANMASPYKGLKIWVAHACK